MNAPYYTLLKNRIVDIVVAPLTLCEIIKHANGAYPTDVNYCIIELLREKEIFLNGGFYSKTHDDLPNARKDMGEKSENNLESIVEKIKKLSKPHPADYDWRFTADTVNELSGLLKSYLRGEKSIALLGVTTLFPVLREVDELCKVDLYNKSSSLIGDLHHMGYRNGLHQHDLFNPIDNTYSYQIVVADPPWYNDFYKAFITRAAEVIEDQGYLFLSLLPELTRPEALVDREYINEICRLNGFSLILESIAFLNYESPNFEKNALRDSGVHCENWRFGNLAIYQHSKKNSNNDIKVEIPKDEPLWDEFIINGLKIKLLSINDNGQKFNAVSTDNTPILSNVSRRSPLRHKISLWTSDNYAFKIDRISVLRQYLRLVTKGEKSENSIKKITSEFQLDQDEIANFTQLLKQSNIHSE